MRQGESRVDDDATKLREKSRGSEWRRHKWGMRRRDGEACVRRSWARGVGFLCGFEMWGGHARRGARAIVSILNFKGARRGAPSKNFWWFTTRAAALPVAMPEDTQALAEKLVKKMSVDDMRMLMCKEGAREKQRLCCPFSRDAPPFYSRRLASLLQQQEFSRRQSRTRSTTSMRWARRLLSTRCRRTSRTSRPTRSRRWSSASSEATRMCRSRPRSTRKARALSRGGFSTYVQCVHMAGGLCGPCERGLSAGAADWVVYLCAHVLLCTM